MRQLIKARPANIREQQQRSVPRAAEHLRHKEQTPLAAFASTIMAMKR